eukprot:7989807-Alexandrium_andersonii.AAC.2
MRAGVGLAGNGPTAGVSGGSDHKRSSIELRPSARPAGVRSSDCATAPKRARMAAGTDAVGRGVRRPPPCGLPRSAGVRNSDCGPPCPTGTSGHSALVLCPEVLKAPGQQARSLNPRDHAQ